VVVCDSTQGQVLDGYQTWPERLYIAVNGRIAYKGGVGPFRFNLDEVESWLSSRYGTEKKIGKETYTNSACQGEQRTERK